MIGKCRISPGGGTDDGAVQDRREGVEEGADTVDGLRVRQVCAHNTTHR